MKVQECSRSYIASKEHSLARPGLESDSGATFFSIKPASQRAAFKFIQTLEEFESTVIRFAESELHFRSFHLKLYNFNVEVVTFLPLFPSRLCCHGLNLY